MPKTQDDFGLMVNLEKARAALIRLSQDATAGEDLDKAERHLSFLRDLGGLVTRVRLELEPEDLPARPNGSLTAGSAKFPRYFKEGNKLVKEGLSRNGQGTYRHRVTRKDYDLIIQEWNLMLNERAPLETTLLNARCPLPLHEPRIVLEVLKEQGLLKSSRKGRWEFVNPTTFERDVDGVWANLPTE